ncbi:hypothetical protein F4604DRAFT_1913225 [Suillus subluteus]|nr:hypothetical protein F4604DRAFT_1913225 [Suillus subluteus]
MVMDPSTPAAQFPFHSTMVPAPNNIQVPHANLKPEGFWVITIGQEVGIFYHWADVAEQVNFISGNVQKSYPSF